MRRKDREVTNRDEIIEIMRKCDVCRLAFNDGEYPYIVPLNFGLFEENGSVVLYFHSAKEGRKLAAIDQNPKVGFEMDTGHKLITGQDACDCTMEYESVIGRGIIEILCDSEKEAALGLLTTRYTNRTKHVFRKEVLAQTAVLKLTVQEMAGKRLKVEKK